MATIRSLFLRFVLILQYYVLENINVLVSKIRPCLGLASLFFFSFCNVIIFNRLNLTDTPDHFYLIVKILYSRFCDLIKSV